MRSGRETRENPGPGSAIPLPETLRPHPPQPSPPCHDHQSLRPKGMVDVQDLVPFTDVSG